MLRSDEVLKLKVGHVVAPKLQVDKIFIKLDKRKASQEGGIEPREPVHNDEDLHLCISRYPMTICAHLSERGHQILVHQGT